MFSRRSFLLAPSAVVLLAPMAEAQPDIHALAQSGSVVPSDAYVLTDTLVIGDDVIVEDSHFTWMGPPDRPMFMIVGKRCALRRCHIEAEGAATVFRLTPSAEPEISHVHALCPGGTAISIG